MFVWFSSDGSGPRMGCCGGGLLLLPLGFLTLFGGFGDTGFLLMLIVVGVLALMFFSPRIGENRRGKLKNDELYESDEEKPKRDERYILTDDGEIVESSDDNRIL